MRREKLQIHNTDKHLPPGHDRGGRGKFVMIAVGFLILVTQILPNDWWFPSPDDFKPDPVPIQRVAELPPAPPEIPVAVLKAERFGPELPPVWKRNAVPVTLQPGKAHVAIVIDDMGVNIAKSREMLEMPPGLTFAFLPYATKVAEMAADARARGHELMVHIPMEPMDPTRDAGTDELITTMTPEELRATVESNLSKFSGYVGINNHMGSKFTADAPAMAQLMAILKEKGLFFLDSKTTALSQGATTATQTGVPFVVRNVFLDDDPSPESVHAEILRLEAIALKEGRAVAIGHPKEHTIAALKEFMVQAEARGIQIVPLSALVLQAAPETSAQAHPQLPASGL